MMRGLLIFLFALGYLWLGVFGTGTKVVFQWPGMLLFGCGFVLLPFTRRGSLVNSASAPCFMLVIVLLAYMVARAWLSPVFYLARLDIILVITIFGVYVAFSTCLSDTRARLIFLLLFLLLGAANTFCAVYQLKVDPGFTMLPGYERQGAGGQLNMPGGFYNLHPHFAGFLEVSVLLGSAIGFIARGLGAIRVLALLGAAIAFIGIALSQSRGSIIATGGGGLVLAGFLVMHFRHQGRLFQSKRKLIFWILGSTAALIVSGIIIFSSYNKRFGSIDSAFSDSGRQNFWVGALDQWRESPVYGNGARSFHYLYSTYRPPEAPFHQRNPEFAHNDYFQQAAEYGLIGVLLILCILFAHITHAMRGISSYARSESKSDPGDSTSLRFALLAGAAAVISAHAIHALVDFNMRMVATAVPVGFCMAILANPGLGINRSNRDWGALGMRGITACCGIGIFMFAGSFGMASWELEKAHLQIKGGKPDMAVSHLTKAIDSDPASAEPLRALALIRYYKKDANLPVFIKVQFQSKALDAYQQVISINPFDWDSQIGAGHCEMFLAWHGGADKAGAHWENAKQYFARAIQLAPTGYKPREAHALYRYNRAYYLRGIGSLVAARHEARLALEEFEAVPGYFVQGAPRGHRANSGIKGARALLKTLKDDAASGASGK
ncbi:MAG: hypothetical protein GY899_18050 [Verrucomicrobiaceae bacterium]|nr:hypothetical protein [Verrucomicrobiaceae bacterium]